MRYSARFIAKAAVIAALYTALTLAVYPISYGMLQFRVSEALMLLAALTPAAVPGLFIGCILANLFGGLGIIDIVFGSTATLLAALAICRIAARQAPVPGDPLPGGIRSRAEWGRAAVLPLPAILFNGIIVGGYLPFVIPEIRGLASSLWIVLAASIGSVMAGEAAVTFVIGLPLYFGIRKTGLFKDDMREKPFAVLFRKDRGTDGAGKTGGHGE